MTTKTAPEGAVLTEPASYLETRTRFTCQESPELDSVLAHTAVLPSALRVSAAAATGRSEGSVSGCTCHCGSRGKCTGNPP